MTDPTTVRTPPISLADVVAELGGRRAALRCIGEFFLAGQVVRAAAVTGELGLLCLRNACQSCTRYSLATRAIRAKTL